MNGSEASKGAADYNLSPGDVIQWDYHDWHATQHVPAIVGAYPEPFVHGMEGKRLPTRLECEQPDGAACKEVSTRLDKLGVPITESAIGAPAGEATLRVVVAKFKSAAQVRAAGALTVGPGHQRRVCALRLGRLNSHAARRARARGSHGARRHAASSPPRSRPRSRSRGS